MTVVVSAVTFLFLVELLVIVAAVPPLLVWRWWQRQADLPQPRRYRHTRRAA